MCIHVKTCILRFRLQLVNSDLWQLSDAQHLLYNVMIQAPWQVYQPFLPDFFIWVWHSGFTACHMRTGFHMISHDFTSDLVTFYIFLQCRWSFADSEWFLSWAAGLGQAAPAFAITLVQVSAQPFEATSKPHLGHPTLKIGNYMIYHGLIWSNMVKYGQIWSNMVLHGMMSIMMYYGRPHYGHLNGTLISHQNVWFHRTPPSFERPSISWGFARLCTFGVQFLDVSQLQGAIVAALWHEPRSSRLAQGTRLSVAIGTQCPDLNVIACQDWTLVEYLYDHVYTRLRDLPPL